MARALTEKMIEILKRAVDEGFEIGLDCTMNGRAWAQKGGLGKGGPSMKIHTNTFDSLERRGLIEINLRFREKFPTRHYRVTKEGVAALREAEGM